MFKKLFLAGILGLFVLVGVLLFRTFQMSSPPKATEATLRSLPLDEPQTFAHLSQAVQFQTQSSGLSPEAQKQAFDGLHRFLKETYPAVFKRLKTQRLDQSLILHWPGSDTQLKPALMMAHLDVVPVAEAKNWQVPAFDGKIDATHIWGRGTLDDKGSVLAILESVQSLLEQNFQPKRSLYIAFGQDEELIGEDGAAKIAKHFAAQNLRFEFALDEGLAIVPGSMIGLQKPVALIGVSEKGFQTIELIASAEGGHSSMPPKETAVSILAQAIQKLNDNPMPPRLTNAAQNMFAALGPHMGFGQKLALANLWLFEPILLNQLSQKPSTNALIRTTMAPTMLQGSPKENVLAATAKATVNLRVLPGDTLESIQAHFKQVLNHPQITVNFLPSRFPEAASESAVSSEGFSMIQNSVQAVYPEAHVAPSLVLATTDSRNYEQLCDNMYRFLPVYFSEEDLSRVHGSNERISKEGYIKSIQFYGQLIGQM